MIASLLAAAHLLLSKQQIMSDIKLSLGSKGWFTSGQIITCNANSGLSKSEKISTYYAIEVKINENLAERSGIRVLEVGLNRIWTLKSIQRLSSSGLEIRKIMWLSSG